MAKIKKHYVSDNVLGWSEEEFDDLICEMVNVQVSNNIRVHPSNQQVYFNHGHNWLMKRWGVEEREKMKSEAEVVHLIMQKTIRKCNLQNHKDFKKSSELQNAANEIDKEIKTLLSVFS